MKRILTITAQVISCSLYAQSTGGSYITTQTYLDQSGTNKLQTRVYDNGLGDLLEECQMGATSSGNDLVTLHEYDDYRRPIKTWLPVISNADGTFVGGRTLQNLARQQYDDQYPYQEQIYNDTYCWTNVLYSYQPGSQYRTANKHQTTFMNAGSLLYITPSVSGLSIKTKSDWLISSRTDDEDGCYTIEWQDFVGNTVATENATGVTYYVYDNRGNLRYVLPPLLYDYINTTYGSRTSSTLAETSDYVKKYAYVYHYDDWSHCIYKKLPGCDPIYYVYDRTGNCILTQDGEQRKKSKWLFSIPDKLGRPCITGVCGNTITYTNCPLQDTHVYVTRDAANDNLKGYSVSGLALSSPAIYTVSYYDNYSFIGRYSIPTSLHSASSALVDTAVHYGLQTGSVVAVMNSTEPVSYLYSAIYYNSRGQVSETIGNNLRGGLITTTQEYTYSGNPSRQTVSTTFSSRAGMTISGIKEETENDYYSYNNLPYHSYYSLLDDSNHVLGRDTLTYTYDDYGHLTGIDRSGTAADMEYDYDLLHGNITEIRSSGGFRQHMYREAGTAYPSYNGSLSAMSWVVPGENLQRQYQYEYDRANRLIEAVYSESVYHVYPPVLSTNNQSLNSTLDLVPLTDSGMRTSTELQNQSSELSPQITLPIDSGGTISNIQNKYGEKINYDRHSNITSLERRGAKNTRIYGLIDDLTITYSGNRRTQVTDAIDNLTYSGSSEFVRNGSGAYTYNANGALTHDDNRGISTIMYDLLGNPSAIIFSNLNSIIYEYAADGTRQKVIHMRMPSATTGNRILRDTTEYYGNLILRNGIPQMLRTQNGYVSFSDSGTVEGWHHYIQDYMGNNRMVVNRDGTIEQKTHYYPYGGVIGDISTNESLQKFKFEGKELDRTFGLDSYDIEARQYFAMAPMWNRVDPLAEKYYGISPYAYCGGDPVNNLDQDGRKILGLDGNPVSYSNGQWSNNTSQDVITICNAMMKSSIGQGLVEKLLTVNRMITMTIDPGYYQRKDGTKDMHRVGNHRYQFDSQKKEILSSTITIYESAVNDMLIEINEADGSNLPEETISGRYRSILGMGNVSKEDMYGGIGVHEATHEIDPASNSIGGVTSSDKEVNPELNEKEHLNQIKQK